MSSRPEAGDSCRLRQIVHLECMRGSHSLSAQWARRTKSRGPKGLQLEVRPRRVPTLLVFDENVDDGDFGGDDDDSMFVWPRPRSQ